MRILRLWGIVLCLLLTACAAPAQTPPAASSEPASSEPALLRDLTPLAQTTPSAVSVPFTVCQTVANWIRPTEAEQSAEIWSLPRYRDASLDLLKKTFQQDFYRYYGGNSELFMWGELGLWNTTGITRCGETGQQALYTGQAIELWILHHRVQAVQRAGAVYTITVQPEAGFEIVQLPGSGEPVETTEIDATIIHFVRDGQVIATLASPPGLAFPRQAPPEGLRETMAALWYGTLTEDHGCLYVVADDLGGRYLPVWPSDFNATVADGQAQIHDGSGAVVARVGDWVRLSGGETGDWLPEGVTGLGDCAGPYWLVGDEVSGVFLADLPTHPAIAPLLDALAQRGIILDAPEPSRASYLYPEPGIVYAVGDGWLHLHLFPDAAITQVRAATIAHDLPNYPPNWVAPPHFYRCDTAMALYLGSDAAVMETLARACGATVAEIRSTQIPASPTPIPTPISETIFAHTKAWLEVSKGQILDAAMLQSLTEEFITDTLAYLDTVFMPNVPLDQQQATLARMAEDLPGQAGGQVVPVNLDVAEFELFVIPNLNGAPLLYGRYGAIGWQLTPVPLPFPEDLATVDMLANLFPHHAEARDLTGDGQAETLVSHMFCGASGFREYLQILRWDGAEFALLFQAELVNWAGESRYTLERDPTQTGATQIALTYPYLYNLGFDHKMLNHPLGRQLWRWNPSGEQFTLAVATVDWEVSAWGTDTEITVEDRLRWLVNEGETRFHQGNYADALDWYDQTLALAKVEAWEPAGKEPHWPAYAAFRRAESLLLLGQTAEGRPAMQAVADAWPDDRLGDLARAFLAGYGDGGDGAAERGIAAMKELPLEDHFYYEKDGTLRFPMQADGILFSGVALIPPAPTWPQVGTFAAP